MSKNDNPTGLNPTFDPQKTVTKGIKDFLITTGSAVGGLALEALLRAFVEYMSDPDHVSTVLSGFPVGVGAALTPVLSACVVMLQNWLKNRKR